LRNELMTVGLGDVLARLSGLDNEELRIQLKVYSTESQNDYDDFLERFDTIQLELTDATELFHLVRSVVSATPAEPYLLSILQHLALIRDDHMVRPKYYRLIAEAVSQIVLQRGGLDPDFQGHFSVNVE